MTMRGVVANGHLTSEPCLLDKQMFREKDERACQRGRKRNDNGSG